MLKNFINNINIFMKIIISVVNDYFNVIEYFDQRNTLFYPVVIH